MSDIKKTIDTLRADLRSLQLAVKELTDSGMKEKTVLILLKHHTGLPQRTIKAVLDGIESLEAEYFGDSE